jgi:hypothetical protein
VLHVAGDFTMQRSGGTATLVANGGTIAVQGNVAVGAGANGGTTVVQFTNSSADQTYTSTGGTLPVLEVANGTRTVSPATGTTDLGVRSLLLTSGTFVAPGGTLSITHDLNQGAGSFVPNGGTLRFSHTGGSSTHNIAINGATGGLLTVQDLTFADGGSGTKTYNLGTGDGFFVRGNLTIEEDILGHQLVPQGRPEEVPRMLPAGGPVDRDVVGAGPAGVAEAERAAVRHETAGTLVQVVHSPRIRAGRFGGLWGFRQGAEGMAPSPRAPASSAARSGPGCGRSSPCCRQRR